MYVYIYVFSIKVNKQLLCISQAVRISDHHGIFTQFFKDPAVILSSNTMFINASTKDFTPYTFSDF